MVWIHGGSNTAGDADDAGFDERTLVRRGIVLVTINYRLGQLGFLVNSDLDAESPHHTSGNYGLMDQIAALHWVQENIGNFGGDPGQVTVFGESAGAYDISLLMTSPLAKGLFARAVAESGAPSGFLRSRTKAYAESIGRKLAAQVKAPKQGTVAFLRTLPPEEILRQTQIATNNDRVGLETSVDGWVLPESPERAYARGKSMAIPLILGSNGQEFAPPTDPAKLNELLEDGYGALADRARQMYGLVGTMPQSDLIYGTPQAQLATDVQFRCPALEQAIGHSAAGHATYLYEFDHPQPGQQYTSHNSELRFLFGVWEPGTELRPIDQKISEQMQSYWINLARTGDPNGDSLPAWPKFQDHSREYMVFADEGAQLKKGVRHNYCELWLQAHGH
jgi:para-nitrobenzyl esterase